MSAADEPEAEARDRLSILLKFVQEISSLSHSSQTPRIVLKREKKKRKNDANENGLIIWESDLRQALDLKCADGSTAITLNASTEDPYFFKIRRSDVVPQKSKKKSGFSVASDAYADLFEVRQEAMREGRGVQLTVGVGLVRWKVSAGQIVEHPLVMIPAELNMNEDGAFVVRMAEATKASLFMFPGIIEAAPALQQLDRCMKDYNYDACPPQPSNRNAWEPLLQRAAHCLHSSGEYKPHAPKTKNGASEQARSSPQVFNTFVIFTREHGRRENTVSKDANALSNALQNMKAGTLPKCLGRLAGIYDFSVRKQIADEAKGDDHKNERGAREIASGPRISFCSRFVRRMTSPFGLARKGSSRYRNDGRGKGNIDESSMLYFGLPSNKQQASAIELLEKNECLVLVGPPGTGKSQTICNTICHYLALGRRVLVCSKGAPAVELLRNKLPTGIRELCVSLGCGDTASFRVLEGAIEHIANEIAAASTRKLRSDADRLRRRLRDIKHELAEAERHEREYARKYFPSNAGSSDCSRDGARSRSNLLDILHADHLALLGVPPDSMSQLADAIAVTLAVESAHVRASYASPSQKDSAMLPPRAYFLADVRIDPLKPPPCEDTVRQVRLLRHGCYLALMWERELSAKASKMSAVNDVTTESLRKLILQLRSRTETLSLINSGELPPLLNCESAETLLAQLSKLREAMQSLECEGTRLAKTGRIDLSSPWTFQILRHCDNASIRRSIGNVAYLIEALQKKWRGVAQIGKVSIPPVLAQMCDMPSTCEYVLTKMMDDAIVDDMIVGKTNEFAREVRWRAHPERLGLMSKIFRAKASQTLLAELAHIAVDGRKPASQGDYQVVHQWIVLRCCEARLRDEWSRLGAVSPSMPKIPEVSLTDTLNTDVRCRTSKKVSASASSPLLDFVQSVHKPVCACVEAVGVAKGIGDVAAKACGRPLVYLNVLKDGVSACDTETEKLRKTLAVLGKGSPRGRSSSTSSDAQLNAAMGHKNALLRELASEVSSEHQFIGNAISPLEKLRRATVNLGRLDIESNEQVVAWMDARKRLRRAMKGLEDLRELKSFVKSASEIPKSWARHIVEASYDDKRDDTDPSTLRDPCPRDARRLWAAIAARNAIREAGRCRRLRETGDKRTIHRLMQQRDACVKLLVAAVAKAELKAAMTSDTCAGLLRLVSAVSAAGRSSQNDGLRAARHRADLASAMESCAESVPCWIMPTWRVSQCLPARIGSFDLVIIDEASQSDITALTALVRGKRLLVVGDHKQVSPTGGFISEATVRDLKARLFASRHPYVEQLLPGRSIFDLAQTCMADARVSLLQHYRCVPQCIQLSNELFYFNRLQPRRLPLKSKRLTPALVDVFVRGGKKVGKINEKEANAVVSYLKKELAEGAELRRRRASVGIISLLGSLQTRLIRKRLLDALTDEQIATHRIVVGEPSTLQGDERDVILLSMVASPGSSPNQVGRLYEQRFNVALSRARDRMVLFRSLKSGDVLSRDDLKRSTISFFERGTKGNALRGRRRKNGEVVTLYTDSTVEGQVLQFLRHSGYSFDTSCCIAGSVAVVEDISHDCRLCVCVDGSGGETFEEWSSHVKEQRSLEMAGWNFFRMWHAEWIVNRSTLERALLKACRSLGLKPSTSPTVSPISDRLGSAASKVEAPIDAMVVEESDETKRPIVPVKMLSPSTPASPSPKRRSQSKSSGRQAKRKKSAKKESTRMTRSNERPAKRKKTVKRESTPNTRSRRSMKVGSSETRKPTRRKRKKSKTGDDDDEWLPDD